MTGTAINLDSVVTTDNIITFQVSLVRRLLGWFMDYVWLKLFLLPNPNIPMHTILVQSSFLIGEQVFNLNHHTRIHLQVLG